MVLWFLARGEGESSKNLYRDAQSRLQNFDHLYTWKRDFMTHQYVKLLQKHLIWNKLGVLGAKVSKMHPILQIGCIVSGFVRTGHIMKSIIRKSIQSFCQFKYCYTDLMNKCKWCTLSFDGWRATFQSSSLGEHHQIAMTMSEEEWGNVWVWIIWRQDTWLLFWTGYRMTSLYY